MTKPMKKPARPEKPHCVVDKKSGKKVACFRTIAEARSHMRKIDAKPGLGSAKKGGCGCGS